MKKTIILAALFISLSPLAFSQVTAGKIIDSAEAENLFGKAEYGIQFAPALLKDYLQSSSYLFFSLNSKILFISNERKEILYPPHGVLKGDEVFHVYSSEVINELINKNSGSSVIIEKRKNVLTLTNGNFTLEFGYLCPPYCNYE